MPKRILEGNYWTNLIIINEKMKIPSKYDLAGDPPYSLDEQCMLDRFFGKSNDDILEMYSKRPLTEEFVYMQPAGLSYYLLSAYKYLQIDESLDDWEFASGLLCSLSCVVRDKEMLSNSLKKQLLEIAKYVENNLKKFCYDKENEDHLLNYINDICAAISDQEK